jgi:Protein of unknown function (DUF4054)
MATPPQNYNAAPTAAQFLADYPEFDTSDQTDPNAVVFSPSAITYWLNQAVLLLNLQRFGQQYYMAVELFIAHNLALEAWSSQGGNQTIPGISKGMIAASASGDVSVTYDNEAVLELEAGHWNNTTYGTRLKRLINMAGAGPLIVGVPGCRGSTFPGGSAGAWCGPWPWNFPSPNGPG